MRHFSFKVKENYYYLILRLVLIRKKHGIPESRPFYYPLQAHKWYHNPFVVCKLRKVSGCVFFGICGISGAFTWDCRLLEQINCGRKETLNKRMTEVWTIGHVQVTWSTTGDIMCWDRFGDVYHAEVLYGGCALTPVWLNRWGQEGYLPRQSHRLCSPSLGQPVWHKISL